MKFRIGHGYDVHRLVPDRKLWLGGVLIPFDKGLQGHSDADVLIHAICDAILGAMGAGDIGKHFPDTDDEYKNIDSKVLLKKVIELMTGSGWNVSNVDSTLVAQEPKIAPHIEEIRNVLSGILDVDVMDISVKATTTEGLGSEGRKESISAHAVVLLYKV